MRKALVLITSLLFVLPAVAHGKGGVEFTTDPDTAKPGERIDFTVIAMSEPPSGSPSPMVGVHPLVTFRSESGQVVRVRAGATNRNGEAFGSVVLPAEGRWTTELRAGTLHITQDQTEPFRVGAGLTQTIPRTRSAPAKPAAGGFPWLWVLSLGSIGSALLVLTMRRRGRWGAA